MTRSLAAAQTIPIRGDVSANIAEHLRLAHVAAEERAQVVVFPELSLTGYELDLADKLAFSESDPRLEPLVRSASTHRVTLIVGAPVRIDSRLYIGAFIVSADGSLDIYTKHHLGAFGRSDSPDGIVPPAESTVFGAGDLNPLFELGGSSAAVAVCADVGRASHAEAAAERGAQTYLASMFVIPSDLESDLATLQSYAARHSMAVAFANYGGPSGGLTSAGCSAIWSPNGELLTQLWPTGAGLAIAHEGESGWRAKRLAR